MLRGGLPDVAVMPTLRGRPLTDWGKNRHSAPVRVRNACLRLAGRPNAILSYLVLGFQSIIVNTPFACAAIATPPATAWPMPPASAWPIAFARRESIFAGFACTAPAPRRSRE